MTEREIKLTLPGRFTMPALVLDGNPLDVAPLPDQQLRATYYDTADLRMARNGVTLRYRTGEAETPQWTLKLPVASRGAELERDELNFEAVRREPPPEVRSLVTAYARGEPLTAVATLRTRRRRIHLIADETPIAEVADDEVSVIEGRRVVSRFREIEVEALTDGVDVRAIGEQLRTAGATESEPIPKVVRALGSRATAPSEIGPRSVPEDGRLADVVARQHRGRAGAHRSPRSPGPPRERRRVSIRCGWRCAGCAATSARSATRWIPTGARRSSRGCERSPMRRPTPATPTSCRCASAPSWMARPPCWRRWSRRSTASAPRRVSD